jgi:protease YdgD
VGYSGDFPTDKYQKYFSAGPGWTASYEAGCSIVKEEANFLLHDCATAGGSSGGAIIGVINGDPYIVALNNAELKNLRTGQDIINLAVKISTIEQALRRN